MMKELLAALLAVAFITICIKLMDKGGACITLTVGNTETPYCVALLDKP